MNTLYLKLIKVQAQLRANKSKYSEFGKYYYRSCEDILESVKPILVENNLTLFLTDKVEMIGNRYYVKATATLVDLDNGNNVSVDGLARECEDKKGMDQAQITGATSSYARKYALNGLFLIDDNKDSDTDAYKRSGNDEEVLPYDIIGNKKKFMCCGKEITSFDWENKHYTIEDSINIGIKRGQKLGVNYCVCGSCERKMENKESEKQETTVQKGTKKTTKK